MPRGFGLLLDYLIAGRDHSDNLDVLCRMFDSHLRHETSLSLKGPEGPEGATSNYDPRP